MSECAICLEKLQTDLITLSCKHTFHRNCILQNCKNSCPLCREPICKEGLCEGNHDLINYFSISNYKKNGKCRICNKINFKKYIKSLK